jgi:tRNA threonylcarbamoyladenosine biosynthesis protein TsaE
VLSFRAATPEDASAVHDVTQRAYASRPPLDPPSGAVTESVDEVRRDLGEHGGLLGLVDGEVIASLRFRRDASAMWLRRVGVVPEHRRNGVGGQLVTHAHAHIAPSDVSELRVGVRFALADNRRFWESLSYTETGSDDHSFILSRRPPYFGVISTPEEMRALGQRLATLLRPGDLIVCVGDLGAGKTTFAQGVGAGLGVEGAVTSPTFVLARAQRSRTGVPFVHADAYRLGAVRDPLGELDALDLDATVDESVTLIEWGEGLAERLTPSRVEVRIAITPDDARTLVIDGLGARWAHEDLRSALVAAAAP